MANILVIAEHEAGQLKLATLSAVAFARKVAAETGGQFEILVIGQDVSSIAELLRSYGASAVLLADHAQLRHPVSDKYAQVIAELVKECGVTMIAAAASTKEATSARSSRNL